MIKARLHRPAYKWLSGIHHGRRRTHKVRQGKLAKAVNEACRKALSGKICRPVPAGRASDALAGGTARLGRQGFCVVLQTLPCRRSRALHPSQDKAPCPRPETPGRHQAWQLRNHVHFTRAKTKRRAPGLRPPARIRPGSSGSRCMHARRAYACSVLRVGRQGAPGLRRSALRRLHVAGHVSKDVRHAERRGHVRLIPAARIPR